MLLIQNLKNNIYLKKVLAVILILMICFSCFLPAPPAEAIILDTAVAVALTLVVGSALVAIGVSATSEHEDFDNLVDDLCQHLIDTGVATVEISLPIINQVAYIPVRIVNAIKDYLFDTGNIYAGTYSITFPDVLTYQVSDYPYCYGYTYIGTITTADEQYIPIVDFIYSCIPAEFVSIINEYVNTYNVDINEFKFASVYYANNYSYVTLTQEDYAHVYNYAFSDCTIIRSHYGNNSNKVIYLKYRNNEVVASTIDGMYMSSPPNIISNRPYQLLTNYGEVSGSICSDGALNVNQSLRDTVGIDEIYPDWAANEQAYQQANEDVIGLPLSVPDVYSDVYGLTQEQAWAGDIATSLQGVDTNVGTITDSMPGILENTGSIATSVSDVATQVGSLVDFFTGSVAVSSPIEGIAFGDLFEKFPFSLPFELVNALSCWVADPVAPDMIVPLPRFTTASNFEIYEYRVNFADIPNMPLAAAMCRGGWMLLFTIGLYKITSSFIKW